MGKLPFQKIVSISRSKTFVWFKHIHQTLQIWLGTLLSLSLSLSLSLTLFSSFTPLSLFWQQKLLDERKRIVLWWQTRVTDLFLQLAWRVGWGEVQPYHRLYCMELIYWLFPTFFLLLQYSTRKVVEKVDSLQMESFFVLAAATVKRSPFSGNTNI